jgi:hypothetical protein
MQHVDSVQDLSKIHQDYSASGCLSILLELVRSRGVLISQTSGWIDVQTGWNFAAIGAHPVRTVALRSGDRIQHPSTGLSDVLVSILRMQGAELTHVKRQNAGGAVVRRMHRSTS